MEVALRIINADERIDDNGIKFVKFLRSKLALHNEIIIDGLGELDIFNLNEYSKDLNSGKIEKNL